MDYRSVGLPDVSYHGLKTWCPMFDRFCRQLGILYCGKYGRKPDGREDDYFYVAFNMHWEPHEDHCGADGKGGSGWEEALQGKDSRKSSRKGRRGR